MSKKKDIIFMPSRYPFGEDGVQVLESTGSTWAKLLPPSLALYWKFLF